ncbi:MAG: hypothetical protein K8R21_09455, partial [Leptospira sp.]|nr:hypothetical protein [Leptospira sp.]
MSKTTKIVLALAVSFILILAVYAICTPEKKNASKIGEKDFMTQKKDPTTVPLGETGFETVGEDAADQLEYYKKWSQYPPYSRPLYSGQVDLLDPYNLVQAPVSVVATPASG